MGAKQMKQQTAVEWFAQRDTELTIEFLEGKLSQIQLAIEKTRCLEQAKAMEKEQIIDAYYQCGKDNFEHIKVINKSATEYYQETYGSNT